MGAQSTGLLSNRWEMLCQGSDTARHTFYLSEPQAQASASHKEKDRQGQTGTETWMTICQPGSPVLSWAPTQ